MPSAKLVRACEQYQMWYEAVYLHSIYEQQDQAYEKELNEMGLAMVKARV